MSACGRHRDLTRLGAMQTILTAEALPLLSRYARVSSRTAVSTPSGDGKTLLLRS
jgi:hypothetical protein